MKRRPPGKDVVGLMYDELRESEKKRQTMVQEKEAKEREECTFSPRVTRSASVMSMRSPQFSMATPASGISVKPAAAASAKPDYDTDFHFTNYDDDQE